MSIGTALFGLTEDEKARRADEFYRVAKDNPAIGDLSGDQFNSALQQYVKDRSFPTSTVKDVAQPETRYNVGPKYDMTNPDGGVPISVMPQTDVTQKVEPQSFPIQMGPGHDVYGLSETGQFTHQPDIPNDAKIERFNDRSYQLAQELSREKIAQMNIEGRQGVAETRANAVRRGGGRGTPMTPQSKINMGTINRMLMASQPRLDTGTGQFITPTVPDELLRAGLAAAKAEGVDLSAYDIPEPTTPEAPTGIWDRVKAAGKTLMGDTPSPSAPAGAPADTSPATALPKAGGGQSDADAVAYLKSIGAKQTPANVAWAKKRKGAPGGK